MTGQAARAGGPARGGGDGSAWTRNFEKRVKRLEIVEKEAVKEKL
jgi:hypothetical protein